jgi:hypothetical protein
MDQGVHVWITFKPNDRRLKAKTDTWEVWSMDGTSHVGQIRWWSSWRKYCFFPKPETVFEQDCLRLIADFVEEKTAVHRKGKRAFPQEVA